MNLIQRATNISLTPKTEWAVIEPETISVGSLYTGYILPLAAIGPIASVLGMSVLGMGVPFLHRTLMLTALSTAVTQYVIGLVAIYLMSLLINALAPTFGAEKNELQALKLTAYAYTPAWIAGVVLLLPVLGILALLAGLYSFYVLYLGLPVMMKAPQDKALGYAAAIVVCAVGVFILMAVLTGIATRIY
jgi:hypothetical protein